MLSCHVLVFFSSYSGKQRKDIHCKLLVKYLSQLGFLKVYELRHSPTSFGDIIYFYQLDYLVSDTDLSKISKFYIRIAFFAIFLLSLDDILSMLYMKVKQHERIDVRVSRQDLLLDGIRQLRRKKSLLGLLRVQFFGESGIDTGGLLKEFLSGKISGSKPGSEM